MTSDYSAIREANIRRYGTDIGRIGGMLLADRYTVRTHFIFELLQNAEDALGRRARWDGLRAVRFHLTHKGLRVSHCGQPFDDADVRGVCGIGKSTKGLTAIGRFGIGFKSVYACTDRPEIHSGTEDFAIENFVWPVASEPLPREAEETVIELPLKPGDAEGHGEIGTGLSKLGASALMFLRQIEEIHWSIEGGQSGLYLRQSEEVDSNVRRVTVIGQERNADDIDQTWLVFSRAVTDNSSRHIGYVEIAFALVEREEGGREEIVGLERSPLIVFFPTELETHLGFLVQGPYRTTPSRDLVPYSDAWNRGLVAETAALLPEALRWLRDHDFLDTAVLRCLPLDSGKFGGDGMFGPVFAAAKQALSEEALLPRYEVGYIAGASAALARTQELRDLFTPQQLGALAGDWGELEWLSADITQDRNAELRRYLMQELNIREITPETIIPRLGQTFLESQPDQWLLGLYDFLNGQPALRSRYSALPLVRLETGAHVAAYRDGRPQAFLPGAVKTAFPTVKSTLCTTGEALAFLRSLGLTEPDPVDDIIDNVLPRYRGEQISVADREYDTDIKRIVTAFAVDSKAQRDKLVAALGATTFLRVVDAGDGGKWFARPDSAYVATDRLKRLFAGIKEIYLVDDSYACLRGEDVRELLEACGSVRYLRPEKATSCSWELLHELRVKAGHEYTSNQNDRVTDWTLKGLDQLLATMPQLASAEQKVRAKDLWEELANLEERRGKGLFTVEYSWTHYGSYSTTFDAAFVRQLNSAPWIADADGDLQPPDFVLCDTLSWAPHPFLQSKIRFRPPVTETLAREVGIEPGVLYLLKKLGVTSEAELRQRLGLDNETEDANGITGVADALASLLGNGPEPTPPVDDPAGSEPSGAGTSSSSGGGHSGGGGGTGNGVTRGHTSTSPGAASTAPGSGAATAQQGNGRQTTGSTSASNGADDPGLDAGQASAGSGNGRPFISYIAAHPEDDDADPDRLDQAERIALEEKAIAFIVAEEPELQRTATHNPGFDLFEASEGGDPARWVEVKAMTGGLDDRPVGLSHTQFACAQTHGDAYWLYVVEHAGNSPRIVRIQDPSGKARTFTFDRGWLAVAAEHFQPQGGERS